MISSCSVSEVLQGEAESGIRPMEYPVVQGGPGNAAFSSPPAEGSPVHTAREEAFARQLEAVRREAVEQGKQMASAESAVWRQQRAAELTRATEDFRSGRDHYLAEVEKEVLRLALAIAEKILHRESQVDPLLLSGSVRKALGQVAESTEVRLRVPADQRELWTDVVRLIPGIPLRPQVIAEPELAAGAATLECSLGTVDLSVRAQLDEIERGFFDRVEMQSPGDAAQRLREAAAGESA